MSSPETWRRCVSWVLALLTLLVVSCGAPAPPDHAVRIVALGDSLTAGFGLSREQAWPALAQAALRQRGWDVVVVNAGVSGDTTEDGLARLPGLLAPPPDLVLVALGGNDGLQRRSPERTEADIDAIVMQVQAAGAQAALMGVRLPVFVQGAWSDLLGAAVRRVAERHDLPLLPDLLEGVLGDPRLLLADGLHPNASGQQVLAERVVDFLSERHRLR